MRQRAGCNEASGEEKRLLYVVCQIVRVNTNMGVYIDVLFENEFAISIDSVSLC